VTVRLPRLKRRHEFVRIARHGRKWAAPGVVLQAAPRAGDGGDQPPGPRVGFTASRKVGNAVVRNRARRRLRALAESILAARAKSDRDYVLIARHDTATLPFAALEAGLVQALVKVDGLKGRP
jgi:ribonuclease P protein component